MNELMKSIIYGTAVGDALGVPVEFIDRDELMENPITDLIGFGTHNQVSGTWSDDTSLLLAIADGVKNGYSLFNIAANFMKWRYGDEFTAHGEVFDCGNTTATALENIAKGKLPLLECGLTDNLSQGNGSLMRTLALVPLVKNLPIKERYKIVSEVSKLTHAHFNCVFGCFFAVEYAITLLEVKDKIKYDVGPLTALILTQDKIRIFVAEHDFNIKPFNRLMGSFENITENDIKSGGYVIDTLEASIWCLIQTTNYRDAVLKAVNLGDDTDTTGAVTGGLAGLFYGYDNIPTEWVNKLANVELITTIIYNTKL